MAPAIRTWVLPQDGALSREDRIQSLSFLRSVWGAGRCWGAGSLKGAVISPWWLTTGALQPHAAPATQGATCRLCLWTEGFIRDSRGGMPGGPGSELAARVSCTPRHKCSGSGRTQRAWMWARAAAQDTMPARVQTPSFWQTRGPPESPCRRRQDLSPSRKEGARAPLCPDLAESGGCRPRAVGAQRVVHRHSDLLRWQLCPLLLRGARAGLTLSASHHL